MSAGSAGAGSSMAARTPAEVITNLYSIFEREFNGHVAALPKLAVDDSDDDAEADVTVAPASSKKRRREKTVPALVHRAPVHSEDMTVASTYHGKVIRFKGNQLILWARKMMSEVIKTPEREARIAEAIRAHTAAIRSPDDWLNYEGMLDAFQNMAAQPSEPFYGVLTVCLNPSVVTTIAFRNKINKKQNAARKWVEEESDLLYSHLHDPRLIEFLAKEFGMPEYRHASNQGLSYPGIVAIIEKFKVYLRCSDAQLAQRQLEIFKGTASGKIGPVDLFLGYFNAVLFGSEASRNSLSFVTGLLILEVIANGELTYKEAFNSPAFDLIKKGEAVPYAVYPMASPFTGPGNFRVYKKLMAVSAEEEKAGELSSDLGMADSRKYPQFAQIQLKEALLLKYFANNIDHKPGWLSAGAAATTGHAAEFARQFNQGIVLILNRYFPSVPRLLVYSKDELHALGWFKPSEKVWVDPVDPGSTITDFSALEWRLTTARPLRLEKDIDDTMDSIRAELEADFSGEGAAGSTTPVMDVLSGGVGVEEEKENAC
jgi:hypothetical protein